MNVSRVCRNLFFVVGTTVLFSSCSFHARIPKDIDIPNSGQQAGIPLRAALYPKPPIGDFVFRAPLIEVKFEDVLARGAEKTLRYIFRDVVVLGADGQNATGQTYDVMVVPEIGKISLLKDVPDCSIEMNWTVLGKSGETIYLNTFRGDGRYDKATTVWTKAEICLGLATQDLFRKAGEGLTATPWWKYR